MRKENKNSVITGGSEVIQKNKIPLTPFIKGEQKGMTNFPLIKGTKGISGFTLVELIIVITILAILATIAFLSFKGYMKDARDGNRVASISNIEKGLGIFNLQTSKYPTPDKKDGQTLLQTGALSISGSIIEYSYLGEIGSGLTTQLRISKTPQDPLSGDKYTYTTTLDGRKYQIASILENPTGYKNNLVKQANAENGYVAKVEGNHQDIVIKEFGTGKYITVVPSLVFDPSGSNILNQSGTLSIVDNENNLPYSPSNGSNIGNTTTAEQLIKEIRNNPLATTATLKLPSGVTLDGSGVLNEWWIPNKNGTNWNTYSSGVILASLGAVGVDGGADYTKLTDVLNGGSANITAQTMTSAVVTPTMQSYDIGNSLRFNGSNSYLSRTPSVAGNQQKLTYSTWFKISNISTTQVLLDARNDGLNRTNIQYTNNGEIRFVDFQASSSATTELISSSLYRDPSTWYNLVLSIDTTQSTASNRIKIYINGVQITSFSKSVYPAQNINTWFNSIYHHDLGAGTLGTSNFFSGYMSDVNFIDSGALTPTSFGQFDANGRWVPQSYTGTYGTNGFHLDFSSSSTNLATSGNQINGGTYAGYSNSAPFDGVEVLGSRNSSTVWSSSQTVASVNGNAYLGQNFGTPKTVGMVRIYQYVADGTSISSAKVQYSSNGSSWSDAGTFAIGDGGTNMSFSPITAQYWRVLANGQNTGVWSIAELGFYPDAGLGADSSGNYNDWQTNGGITQASNQMIDSPSNNFATLNPLSSSNFNNGISYTLSNGNLTMTSGNYSTNNWSTLSFTQPFSGKIYSEFLFQTKGAGNMASINVGPTSITWNYNYGGTLTVNGVNQGGSLSPGDYIGVALDADNGKMWVRFNGGAWLGGGNPELGSNPTYTGVWKQPAVGYVTVAVDGTNANGSIVTSRFDSKYWLGTAPTGFNTLSTKNLTYTIEKPKQYFDVLTYPGDGQSTHYLTGLLFQPDLGWFKSRTSATYPDHFLEDSLRGMSSVLSTNTNASENLSGFLHAFQTSGFALNSSPKGNEAGQNYVSWNWKKSTTAGFDIVSYTGDGTANRDIPHNAGVNTSFIIIKRTDSNSDWWTWHWNYNSGCAFIGLNTTNASNTVNSPWGCYFNNSVFRVTNNSTNNANASGGQYVAYVWSEVPGYSKFGSYTGNGSATGDGPFVYTGFKPKYLMIKRTDIGGAGFDWFIWDSLRNTYNPATANLTANQSVQEGITTYPTDLLSNGFKLRHNGTAYNASGGTYIYAAFAELPFK